MRVYGEKSTNALLNLKDSVVGKLDQNGDGELV